MQILSNGSKLDTIDAVSKGTKCQTGFNGNEKFIIIIHSFKVYRHIGIRVYLKRFAASFYIDIYVNALRHN